MEQAQKDKSPGGIVAIDTAKQPTIVLTVIMQHGAALSLPEVLGISADLSTRQSRERRGNRFATAPNRKGNR